MSQRRRFGDAGEQAAVDWLVASNWQIIDRNWRCPEGEVDIVALDPDGVLVFVEVKTRAGTGFGYPLEALDDAKLRRMRAVARQWMRSHKGRGRGMRIDAVGIIRHRGYAPQFSYARAVA